MAVRTLTGRLPFTCALAAFRAFRLFAAAAHRQRLVVVKGRFTCRVQTLVGAPFPTLWCVTRLRLDNNKGIPLGGVYRYLCHHVLPDPTRGGDDAPPQVPSCPIVSLLRVADQCLYPRLYG